MSAVPTEPSSPDRAADALPLRREVPLVPAASIAGRALVTVIAIMTFLASLAAGSASLVEGAAREWQSSVAEEVTVQVRPTAGHDIDAEVARATDLAKATRGIAGVEAYSKAEASRLLEPWLGSGLDLDDLPIPRLIVVKVDHGAAPDLGALRQALEGQVAGASLDDHGL